MLREVKEAAGNDPDIIVLDLPPSPPTAVELTILTVFPLSSFARYRSVSNWLWPTIAL